MRHAGRLHGERGASLLIALVFLAVFGIVTVAILGFGDASLRASQGYRTQRAVNYATDAALDGAINRVRHDTTIGRDPAVFTADMCNPANNQAVYTQPATSTTPAMVVSCQTEADGGSGVPADLGSNPPFALLSLGDRRSDGSLGVRNTEPGPYNGAGGLTDLLCPGNRQESGIRFNNSVAPLSCTSPPESTQWNVRGDVFSNSKIVVDPVASIFGGPTPIAGPVMIAPRTGATGIVKARGGCSGTGFTCTDVGWNFADGLGQDPAIANPADYAPASLSGLTVQSVPPASKCSTGNGVVEFSPGIYTDGAALNTLFGDPACKNATFWFKPGTGHQTGVYYFDFRNTSVPGYACGTDISFFSPPTGNLSHAWCVGGRAADYSGQRVIGGTPFAWSPTADPTTHQVTLEPAANAGNGTGFFGFLQQTGFKTPESAKAMGGTPPLTADLTMSAGTPGGSIWLSGFPQVPRGGYGLGLDLELAQSGDTVNRMNAPTVQVNYGALLTGGTCGPYTLPKPPADGSLATIKLSVVNPAAAADLAACLNSGDRINTAVVQYNVSRPWFQTSDPPTARLDGARFTLTAKDQPDFPRVPTATDPGGDCDVKQPGVQFIFGGDSHVYVANGGMELCAGPNPADPANGKQIAVYGVPAAPRLVPVSVSGTSANDGVTNPNNALRIAEGSGLAAADIKYHATSLTGTYEGSETLHFSGYTPPAGYTVGKVEMRASYDNSSSCFLFSCTAPMYDLVGLAGSTCTSQTMTSGSAMQAQTVDVTPCMTAANRIASPFDVKWHAKSSCFFFSCPAANDQLDGIEFVVTLLPDNPDTALRPASGCMTSSPDYWYGTNSPECALLKVDAPFLSGISERRGRMSINGTVYAPSAAIDVDDTDVFYPIFGRGLIARHFRLKGFGYHPGYSAPIADNFLDTTAAARSVVFLACKKDTGACLPDDPALSGRATATFDATTSAPSVKRWSVSQR